MNMVVQNQNVYVISDIHNLADWIESKPFYINLDFSFRADNPDRLRSRVQMLQLRGLSRGDQAE